MSAAVAVRQPTMPGATSVQPHPPVKTLFSNCVERINSSTSFAEKEQRDATVRKIQGYAVLALFVAAAAATLVCVGIFAPVYVPVATIVLFTLQVPVLKIFQKYFHAPAKQLEMQAEETRLIAQEYQKIQSDTGFSPYFDILSLAPQTRHTDLDKLKYPLAFYRYWHHLYTVNNEAMQKYVEEARRAQEPDKITSNYLIAAKLRQEALASKVSAAVFAAVIQRPTYAGAANDICSLNEFIPPASDVRVKADGTAIPVHSTTEIGGSVMDTWAQHAIYREFNDTRADHFVVFKNRDIAPLTMQQVETLTINEIAARILAAMPAA